LTASSPEQIYWYSVPSGGSLLATGTTYNTPSISVSTTYYVEAGSTCFSQRIPVQALITTQPNPPVVFDTSSCTPGSLVIRAISSNRVNWYDTPVGGNVLDTGLYFTTPSISATTTYYADAGIGCNSIRVPVVASIGSLISPPIAYNVSRCGPGSVTLSAISTEQIYWYDAPSGGNQLALGSTFTTPPLSATTTYYVEAGNVCLSPRIPVLAILGGTNANTIIEGAICGSGSVTLFASSAQTVDSLVWYDQPGGTILGTGSYFTTPFLSASTPYYVVAYSSCTGLPVTVNALGADTVYMVNNQPITLNAGNGFNSYTWSTTEVTSSIVVNSGGWYSVFVTDSNGCGVSDSVYVESITGISSIDGKNQLLVYPNPTHDLLNISMPESTSKEFTLKILSIDGKVILQEVIKNTYTKMQNKELSLQKLAAGVYILELMSSDYFATARVFVQ
jgi:hypothetical protein